MKEFNVNEYITLKLEDDKTNIYVVGELFKQCKSLLLNIAIDDLESYDQINSLDEAEEIYKYSIHDGQIFGEHSNRLESEEFQLLPEEEFWGHCSNLQVWIENNYDTCLLHSDLSFPLLKKLTEVGDPEAKKVLKDEIAKRLSSCHLSIVEFLIDQGYLKLFNKEEIRALFIDFDYTIITSQKVHVASPLLNKLAELGDPIAKRVFKDEIVNRFLSRNENAITFLVNRGYLKHFDKEELNSLFDRFDLKIVENIDFFERLYFLSSLIELDFQYAKELFRKEIIKPFHSGDLESLGEIFLEEFPQYLDENEIKQLFLANNSKLKLFVENCENKFESNCFSILYNLTKLGDPIARKIHNQEVIEQFHTKDIDTIHSLINDDYLEFFDDNEFAQIFLKNNQRLKNKLEKDSNTIYRNSFQVVKKLVTWGDPLAKKMLKQLIIAQFRSKDLPTISTLIEILIEEEYIKIFTQDELKLVFLENNPWLRNKFEDLGECMGGSKFIVIYQLINWGDQIAKEIFENSNIREINLYPSYIHEFPDIICNLPSLRKLKLTHNYL
ncbi:MAG: hypothetical protein ACFFG0_16395 [Candidatus Thorarchaeota archaeon]